MKKKLLFILILSFLSSEIVAQTQYLNVKKYNYFRQRLRDDFMIVDPDNKQGTNIPASTRNHWGFVLDFGENTMIGSIAPYLMLLATEYAVNEKYGLDNTQTLNELSYLLKAIERLDLNAEKFFKSQIAISDTNFWNEIDNYIDSENDLNGFFIRNDIDGYRDTIYDYTISGLRPRKISDNIAGQTRLYALNPNNNLFAYNNAQLDYVDYFINFNNNYNNNDKGLGLAGMFNGINITEKNRAEMSLDEASWLFWGLAFVSRLVEDERLFTDTEGEQISIRRWCSKIAYRNLMALHNETEGWKIINPVTNEIVPAGGKSGAYSAGYQIATYYILLQDPSFFEYPNIYEEQIAEIFALQSKNDFAFHFEILNLFYSFISSVPYGEGIYPGVDEMYEQLSNNVNERILDLKIHGISIPANWEMPDKFNFKTLTRLYGYNMGIIAAIFNDYFHFSNIPWLNDISTASFTFSNTIKFMNIYTNKYNTINYEFYPLFFSILHNIDIENEWVEFDDGLTYSNFVDSIGMLLNVMPECGSYSNMKTGNYSDKYWYTSRLTNMNRIRIHDECDVVPEGSQINSNMDYMILHNLFYLLLSDDYNETGSTAWANRDYPYLPFPSFPYYIGSHDNPKISYGSQFEMNHTVFEDGNISLIADDYIELLPGFEVKEGCTFIGEIRTFKPSCSFNFTGTNPCLKQNEVDSIFFTGNNIDKTTNPLDGLINKYTIFPNPVSTELTLVIKDDIGVNTVKLIDFSGKTIQTYKDFGKYLTIDFSILPNGIYLLVIESNEDITTKKIIKK